jgi:hypothetical protein
MVRVTRLASLGSAVSSGNGALEPTKAHGGSLQTAAVDGAVAGVAGVANKQTHPQSHPHPHPKAQ